MARDYYESTIALPDPAAGNVLKPLAGVKVSVVPRGATDVAGSLADIFPADTGVAEGPDPKSGATGTNPFVTNASGSVRFWADGPAEYDLVFEDTIVPVRITDRVGWNAYPSKAGSIPASSLSTDGIKQAQLHAEVVANEVPIGGVIEWWRPSAGVAVPAGYVICDGKTTLAAGQHDFAGHAGSVTVPDLRNRFILGADHTKGDGTGAGNGGTDAVTDAPGIRGAGGANQVTLDATQIPAHSHPITDKYHSHGMDAAGIHKHTGNTDTRNVLEGNFYFPATDVGWHGEWHRGTTNAADTSVVVASPGSVTAVVRTIIAGQGTHSHLLDMSMEANHTHVGHQQLTGITSTNNNTGGGVGHTNMPLWVGLLRIMKVRRV